MLRPGATDLERLPSQADWPSAIEVLVMPKVDLRSVWLGEAVDVVPTVRLDGYEMAAAGSSLRVIVYAERPADVDVTRWHAELAMRAGAALRLR
jgi:hypothetical protein